MTNLHGKVIGYSDIKNLPKRDDFLDKKIYQKIDDDIKLCKPLMFMPNHVFETNISLKKYEKSSYAIALTGVLVDGRKKTIILSGILPYFEVMLPIGCDTEEMRKTLLDKLSCLSITKRDNTEQKIAPPVSHSIFKAKKFLGYEEEKRTFIRFEYNKLFDRKEAINWILTNTWARKIGLDTTSDDKSCYYRVVCRDYLTTFTSWVEISYYDKKKLQTFSNTVLVVNIKNYKKYEGDITQDPILKKDLSMTACWDIETFSPDGELPEPQYPDHKMFMIGATFQWYHSDDQILRVCIVDYPCEPKENYLTIVCGCEKNIIRAFILLLNKMKPEFILGFNDSDYDWRWLIERIKTYDLLEYSIKKLNINKPWDDKLTFANCLRLIKKSEIKLEADSRAYGTTIECNGYINIDVRTIFRQLYPTAEKTSLNYFLSKNKLGGKIDMPYQEMFRIYKAMGKIIEDNKIDVNMTNLDKLSNNEEYINLRKRMGSVAEYCVIDSQRCHELMKIRSVIMDRREVSNMAYTSMYDAIYRANGMKVRNLVIAKGKKCGIRFSNIRKGGEIVDAKYPGAYVFPPKKGLVVSKLSLKERCESKLPEHAIWKNITDDEKNKIYDIIEEHGATIPDAEKFGFDKHVTDFLKEPTGRPITGLDFSSLYPSLMMAYNLSPEYIIMDKKKAREADSKGHNLHRIDFPFNGGRVKAWSIRHDNKLEFGKPDFKFGVYPMILKELFDKRKEMKKILHKYESEKEDIENPEKKRLITEKDKEYYEDVCFNFNYIDSKQKALKVFMNTFYGEAGNKISPFFILPLAGAITTAGQNNIHMVQDYIVSVGCNIFYGDTDSIYSAMPEKYFTEMDKKYYTEKINKLDYWTKQVDKTFEVVEVINKEVNNMLIADNGTMFLKMAYEEALFPVAFLAKKKYYGIPHISVANFQPKSLFIRGLEVKKRGVSTILRKVCESIMWDSVKSENIYTLLQLVENKIDEIYKTKWSHSDFIMTAIYKPKKQNVKVKTFAERMIKENVGIEEHERFNYVIIKKNPYKYDYRGRKVELKVGEKMEYADRAEKLEMPIDLDYYMSNGINGQLARLVTYHNMFQIETDGSSEDEIKANELKIYENAKKYISKYCENYLEKYPSKGSIYQKIYRKSSNAVMNVLKKKCPTELINVFKASYDIDEFDIWIFEKAEKIGSKSSDKYGEIYVEERLNNEKFYNKAIGKKENRNILVKEMQFVYFSPMNENNISKLREKIFKESERILKQQLSDNIIVIKNLLCKNIDVINNVSNVIKRITNIDNLYNKSGDIVPSFENVPNIKRIDENKINEIAKCEANNILENKEMCDAIDKLKEVYTNMICNYKFIYNTRSIIKYLKQIRDRKNGKPSYPNDKLTKNIINNSIQFVMNL